MLISLFSKAVMTRNVVMIKELTKGLVVFGFIPSAGLRRAVSPDPSSDSNSANDTKSAIDPNLICSSKLLFVAVLVCRIAFQCLDHVSQRGTGSSVECVRSLYFQVVATFLLLTKCSRYLLCSILHSLKCRSAYFCDMVYVPTVYFPHSSCFDFLSHCRFDKS